MRPKIIWQAIFLCAYQEQIDSVKLEITLSQTLLKFVVEAHSSQAPINLAEDSSF